MMRVARSSTACSNGRYSRYASATAVRMRETTTSECQCTTHGTARASASVSAQNTELLGICRCSTSG